MQSAAQTAVTVEYMLPPQHSLFLRRRFAPDALLSVKLVSQSLPGDGSATGGASGVLETAEMLGCDVKPDILYVLPSGTSVSLYSHTGCTVAVAGDPVTLQQVFLAPPGSAMLRGASELHYRLEELRVAAKKALDAGDDGAVGPRVLVCSATGGCGKSTLVQLLANYAVRLRYHPLVVDLDVDCPSAGSLPTGIAVHCLQYQVDVTEGYSLSPSGLHVHYGADDYGWNTALMTDLLRTVSDACISRQSRFPRSRVGGIFIDYPTVDAQAVLEAQAQQVAEGSSGVGGLANIKANPIDALITALGMFDVDTVIVVGADWLRHELHSTCVERFGASSGPTAAVGGAGAADDPTVLPLPRQATARLYSFPASEFAAPRAPAHKDALRRQQWLQYLFGTATSPVTPTLVHLELSKVRLVRTKANQAESMQGLLPMQDTTLDGDGGDADPMGHRPAANPMQHIQELTVADVKLPGMLVGISDAPSMKVAATGIEQPVSYEQFFHAVGRCTVAGYALVREVTATTVTLLTPNGGLPLQRNGLTCLLLTDTFLAMR